MCIRDRYQRGRAWCAAPDPPLQDVIGTMWLTSNKSTAPVVINAQNPLSHPLFLWSFKYTGISSFKYKGISESKNNRWVQEIQEICQAYAYLVDGQFFLQVLLQLVNRMFPEASNNNRECWRGLSLQLHLPLLKLLPASQFQVASILHKTQQISDNLNFRSPASYTKHNKSVTISTSGRQHPTQNTTNQWQSQLQVASILHQTHEFNNSYYEYGIHETTILVHVREKNCLFQL